jgi:outer membrane receptor for ferrienterochelin and colicins
MIKTFQKIFIFLILGIISNSFANAKTETGFIKGTIIDEITNEGLIGANIILMGTELGAASDLNGDFFIESAPTGQYTLQIRYLGYHTKEHKIQILPNQTTEVLLDLTFTALSGESVVVTASRNSQKRNEAPVIVNIIDEFVFDNTQSLSLSEGLNFQPGVRMEVDCQTCNYTQIRMNGLGGSYSQILIDSRPVFSPLNGLYGLDYIPTNMIEQVETIRGGGSALFGASAIGGVVNILTKEPTDNQFSLAFNNSTIDGKTPDQVLTLNSSVINESRDFGAHFFGMLRDRDSYDNNGDSFSEIPRMNINSFGLRTFYKPTNMSKLTLEAHSIKEQRQGGNRTEGPPHEADQAEFRDHQLLGGGLNFETYVTTNLHKLSAYISSQKTDRAHYTGLDQDLDAYGTTKNLTFVSGLQYSHNLNNFIGNTNNTITIGIEGNYDDVDDRIPGFGIRTDQITKQIGTYFQSDWQLNSKLKTLLGARLDYHNLVNTPVINPRATVLYSLSEKLQWRGSFSTGFRAPQAFDADLHIAFAGGGISRIRLDENLKKERSISYSTSFDYNTSYEEYFLGFTFEGFYTRLYDAFILEEAETTFDDNLILERRNGGNSKVFGVSGELRLNINNRLQLGASLTVQENQYEEPVFWSADVAPTGTFLRTPNFYGSYTADFKIMEPLNISISGVLTGPMDVPHLAGYIQNDVLERSPTFLETNFKINYQISMKSASKIKLFAGVQNAFNQYQNDFDKFKDRDSNYVYGTSRPRTVFSGVEISY